MIYILWLISLVFWLGVGWFCTTKTKIEFDLCKVFTSLASVPFGIITLIIIAHFILPDIF